VPVGGALFGMSVHGAQQGVDIEVGTHIGSGQQIHSLAQPGQMLREHRVELAGVRRR
jgi:hypothetical protein